MTTDLDALVQTMRLQRLLESRLHAETLRRAIEAERAPPGARELYRYEARVNYSADAVDVSYTVRHARNVEQYTESYTLAEIVRLALTEAK